MTYQKQSFCMVIYLIQKNLLKLIFRLELQKKRNICFFARNYPGL